MATVEFPSADSASSNPAAQHNGVVQQGVQRGYLPSSPPMPYDSPPPPLGQQPTAQRQQLTHNQQSNKVAMSPPQQPQQDLPPVTLLNIVPSPQIQPILDQQRQQHPIQHLPPTRHSGAALMPAPPVEVKLFVGRVPHAYNEDSLRPIFSEFGPIGDVVIIRDRDTGAHKGLNNQKTLDTALGPLQVKYAQGEYERLGIMQESVQPGVDQVKLFVGSLPKQATEEDIHEVFSRYGVIDEVFIIRDDQKTSKGCAFVRFAYKEEAFHAIANLNGKFTLAGSTRAIEVRFAENKKAHQTQQQQQSQLAGGAVSRMPWGSFPWQEYFTTDGRPYYYNQSSGTTQWERPQDYDNAMVKGSMGAQIHGPLGANVFVFHIPNEWSEHELIQHFTGFGQIVSARIATEKGTGRRLGFGFVSYTEIGSAVAACSHLNGFQVTGKRLKVTIKRGEEQYAGQFVNTIQRPPLPIPSKPQPSSPSSHMRSYGGAVGSLPSLALGQHHPMSPMSAGGVPMDQGQISSGGSQRMHMTPSHRMPYQDQPNINAYPALHTYLHQQATVR